MTPIYVQGTTRSQGRWARSPPIEELGSGRTNSGSKGGRSEGQSRLAAAISVSVRFGKSVTRERYGGLLDPSNLRPEPKYQ